MVSRATEQSVLELGGGGGLWVEGAEETNLRNILQALQLVVLSNVYIWKL